MSSVLPSVVVFVARTGLLLAAVIGAPWALVTQIPITAPDMPAHGTGVGALIDRLTQLISTPVTDTLVLQLLAAAGWVLWAAFMICVLTEAAALMAGIKAPHLPGLSPLQGLASWLLTGAAAGLLAATSVTMPVPHAAPTGAIVHQSELVATQNTMPTAISVRMGAMTYRVRAGDRLGDIAERFLGDASRYPLIREVNTDLIPDTSGAHGPDHIRAGWPLTLPAGARDHGPRQHATGTIIDRNPSPSRDSHDHSGSRPTSPRVAEDASPRTPITPAPISPTATAESPSRPPATATATPSPADTDHPDAHQSQDGVSLLGGWISIPFALALLVVATTVWLRRRYEFRYPEPTDTQQDPDRPSNIRFEAGDLDDDLQPLPGVVSHLRRTVREHAARLPQTEPASADLEPTEATLGPRGSGSTRPTAIPTSIVAPTPSTGDPSSAGSSAPVPLPPVGPSGPDLAGLPLPPKEGLGLDGPGADAAARALLIAALTAGGPDDPDARGQVITTLDTLNALFSATDVVGATDIPRVSVAASLDEALTLLDEQILERRRILDEHDITDIHVLRDQAPYSPPMPPLLLLVDVPAPEHRARLTTSVHLGAALHIHAVLRGTWPRGETLTIDTDGYTTQPQPPTSARHHSTNRPTGQPGQRIATLNQDTGSHLLQILHEAQVSKPRPTSFPRPSNPLTQLLPPTSTGTTNPGTASSSPAMGTPPSSSGETSTLAVRISLLGQPTVLDRDGHPAPAMRQNATQLLTYLTVHRDGARLPDIMEALWPEATLRRASERLATEVGNLRRIVRQAAADPKAQAVINTGGHYHLNPDLLDIDVWQLTDNLREATTITEPTTRIRLLRAAVTAHTGVFAEGRDYEWIEPHREQLRRNGIRAHLALAELLTPIDPGESATLIIQAAALDPHSEDLAQRAMRALSAIGNSEGVRQQLRTLRAALDEIDEEPSGETLAIAAHLTMKSETASPDRKAR